MEGLRRFWPAQWPLTILATALLYHSLRTRGDNLGLLVTALAVGVLAALLWLSRRLQEHAHYKKAMQLVESGRYTEAFGLLIKAEEAWDLNSAHDTPRTIVKDFQPLATLVAAIQEQADRLRLGLDTKDYLAAMATSIRVYSDRKSLVFGTYRLKAVPKSICLPQLRLQVLVGRWSRSANDC
jgi:hypothetical protein